MCAPGGDPVVPQSRDPPGHDLRHPGGHLELWLHPGRAGPEEASVPRAVRDRPAGKDIRGPRDSIGGRVAQGLLSGAGGLLAQELSGSGLSLPGYRAPGIRFIKGKKRQLGSQLSPA